jgi:hypothetical protein
LALSSIPLSFNLLILIDLLALSYPSPSAKILHCEAGEKVLEQHLDAIVHFARGGWRALGHHRQPCRHHRHITNCSRIEWYSRIGLQRFVGPFFNPLIFNLLILIDLLALSYPTLSTEILHHEAGEKVLEQHLDAIAHFARGGWRASGYRQPCRHHRHITNCSRIERYSRIGLQRFLHLSSQQMEKFSPFILKMYYFPFLVWHYA